MNAFGIMFAINIYSALGEQSAFVSCLLRGDIYNKKEMASLAVSFWPHNKIYRKEASSPSFKKISR